MLSDMTDKSNQGYPCWAGWPGARPAVIAEVGMNHGGSPELAWEMIVSAHQNGADFVKLQSYVTEEFFHPSLSYLQSTKSMELSFESQAMLFRKAKDAGIRLVTTPFDFKSVDFAEQNELPFHKIASMDNDNIPLIECIASTKRPVLVSCGFAKTSEIEKILEVFERTGNDKLVLLHCVSDYPAKNENMNLEAIRYMNKAFGVPVGLSDHSMGIECAKVGLSLGAVVVEKHFTTDRGLLEKIPDADHDISITPDELKELAAFAKKLQEMLGKAPRKITANEANGRKGMRRGLYARQDVQPGDQLSLGNTILLRPVEGIAAGHWDEIAGKAFKNAVKKGFPIHFHDLVL